MAKLSEMKPNENLKVLVFGDSGAGKTVFATSFPGPIYVHDFDGKLASAANFWRSNNPEQLGQIEYTDYGAILGSGTNNEALAEDTIKQRYATFWGWMVENQKLAREGKFPYKTVVLDSLTLWSDLLLKEVLRQSKGKIKGPIPGREDIAGLQHYGVNSTMFKEHLNALLAMPCNVVVTAHIDVTKDDMTGEILRRPLVSGKLAAYLPIIFGEVYRAYAEQKDGKTVYFAQTRTDSKFSCRSQITNLPGTIELSYKNLAR